MTWSEFLVKFTASPWSALQELGALMGSNLARNWWQLVLILFAFWVARLVVFALLEVVIPSRLATAPPKWARGRVVKVWRDRLYRASLESRHVHRMRAATSLTKAFVEPVMWVVVFLTVASQLGLHTSPQTGAWLVGGFSLAFGLGAQGVVKDIIAGITVLIVDEYAVGDYIDAQFGASGVVRKIGLRFTELEGTDGTLWFIRHSEIPKLGNRTASRSMVVTDITLTWNEEGKHITMEDLRFAELTLDETVKNLAETLLGVDRVAKNEPLPVDQGGVPLGQIAQVVPDLVPTMDAERLYSLKESSNEDTLVHKAVKAIPGKVPIFTRVETLGLVNSSVNSVTIRLRITLPPMSLRAQGMAVLRRNVFEAFVQHDITPEFEEAPEGSVLLTTVDGEPTAPRAT